MGRKTGIAIVSILLGCGMNKDYRDSRNDPNDWDLRGINQEADDGPFAAIGSVLRHPRCANCHPEGDRPLQGAGKPHGLGVVSSSVCGDCHGERNRGPIPGSVNWKMPPRDVPMVFHGQSDYTLCAQWHDPQKNGGRTLESQLLHVKEDETVRAAFHPPATLESPPLSHGTFIEAIEAWLAAGALCP
jgi:hypothetical protein